MKTATAQNVQQLSIPVTMLQVPTAEVTKIPTAATALAQSHRDHLLMEHLPTVRFVARQVLERLPQHIELDELISAGTLGLVDAVAKFDIEKQVQFKSYAQFRIKGAILDSLRTSDWGSRELRRKGRAMQEAAHFLSAKLGRTPTDTEMAVEMGMTLQTYQQTAGEIRGLDLGSLNLERTDEFGEEELACLSSAATEDPLFQCLQGEMRQRLSAAIDGLPEKERLVLTLYYFEELTMKEIGLTLSVVESRVSQIHSSAVKKLRAALGVAPARKPASRNLN